MHLCYVGTDIAEECRQVVLLLTDKHMTTVAKNSRN